MDQQPDDLTPDQLNELSSEFEALGFMTFNLEADQPFLQALMNYIRKHHVPTETFLDREQGTITVTKRGMGSLEGLG